MAICTTTRRVRVYLGGAVTTNQLKWNSNWVDINNTSYVTTPDSTGGETTDATPIEIVGVAASGYKRQVTYITVHNVDTVAATVFVEVYDGSTQRLWYRATLDPNWTLEWEHGGSWKVYDADGRQKIETTPGTGGGGVAIAGGAATATSGTVVFSNSNGVTFGLAGSVMTASVLAQTAQTLGWYMSSQTTGGASSGTVDARSHTLVGAGNVSVGISNGSILISGGGGGGGIAASAAGSSVSGGTVVWSNSNNVSFGMNGSTITATATFAQSTQPVAASGSNGSFLFSTLSFGNSNGFSFYTTNGSIVGSNALTSQSNQAFSGSNGSSTFQTITFGNSNGISFYLTNGSLVASHSTQQSTQPVAVSGSNGSFAFSTLSLGALNGATFYSTNNSIALSYTVPTQTNQTLGLYALGNTTGASSSSTFDARTLSFNAAGNAMVGFSAGSILISVTGAGGADGYNAAQFAGTTANSTMPIVWAGNSAGSGNITLGLTGSTVTGSAPAGGAGPTLRFYDHVQPLGGTVVIAPMASTSYVQPLHLHNNYSFDYLRFPLSMSAISTTFSVSGGAGSFTASNVSTMWAILYSLGAGASSQSLVSVASASGAWTHLKSISMNTSSTNTSRTYSVSHYWTLPYLGGTTSTSASTTGAGVSVSIASGPMSNFNGIRLVDLVPWGSSIPAGIYWLALGWSSSTGSQSFSALTGGRIAQSFLGVSQITNALGFAGSATNSSLMPQLGIGSFTTNAIGVTSIFPLSRISSSASHPIIAFAGLGGVGV